MIDELNDIQEACSDVHWFIDQDDDTLINALDGNDEQVWEFKMAFADLETRVYLLREAIAQNWEWSERYPRRSTTAP